MPQDLEPLRELFSKSRESITAIGDETRQAILLTLMAGPAEGMRVGDITEHTHLSQPAVSHHLKILRNANLLSLHKVGTMNFYRLNPDRAEITRLLRLCQGILAAMENCELNEHGRVWSV
ncbi:Regulatory protein, ArsR [uncultured Eubacteriales bacterium]|uniref:Regulatory protein, ArsR n=1 Tax=uncultured Eubacteriales bacterium TaxID=172733 RepID=A0A212IYF3_9FIRM|nr:Regulatory protein, ArsR [uncultured Eubacteriales bacterium]